MNTVKKYGCFELTLTGPSTGNPYLDVEFQARFQIGNRYMMVPGFYDGNGVYKLRFMPLHEGTWDYVITANVLELDGIDGKLLVEPAAEGDHGPVRVAKTFHFAHDDGTPFRPFGTTAYNWVNQKPEIVEETFRTLSKNAFNKLRMAAFPKHYLYNRNEPQMFAFAGGLREGVDSENFAPRMSREEMRAAYDFDFDTPNYDFWKFYDGILQRLNRMGIECDFILFHPYDRWGFSEMGQERNRRYVKYMVARYAAYPNVWWSLANEWDFFHSWTVEDWEAIADVLVQWDYVEHLRSIYHCFELYDYSRGWISHCSIQRHDGELIPGWRKQWKKPVVLDEMAYEGNIDNFFGNIPGEEMVRRFWIACMRGGYGTHGECYECEDDLLWWAKGSKLYGTSPARIAFLRQIIEDAPPYLELPPNLDRGTPWLHGGKRYQSKCMTPFGETMEEKAEYMLSYYGFVQPKFQNIPLPEDHKYQIDIIDTWNMTITPIEGLHSGMTRVDLPQRPYIAVRYREVTA